MSTEPEPASKDTTDAVDTGPETPGTAEVSAPGTPDTAEPDTAEPDATEPDATEPDATAESAAGSGDGGEAAAQVSEGEAELAAQRVERERIERRKAGKQGPIDAGGKLSGTAADLLAAVRAVESGEKP
ncbi:DNA helicase RecD, partial [Streptomyces coelicoflavus]|nr:DNA helicase RecD [Streptomyces coelicoflavus]